MQIPPPVLPSRSYRRRRQRTPNSSVDKEQTENQPSNINIHDENEERGHGNCDNEEDAPPSKREQQNVNKKIHKTKKMSNRANCGPPEMYEGSDGSEVRTNVSYFLYAHNGVGLIHISMYINNIN